LLDSAFQAANVSIRQPINYEFDGEGAKLDDDHSRVCDGGVATFADALRCLSS
jgi:hypothetical protein